MLYFHTLQTEADIAAYLNAALEGSGTSVIAATLGDIVRTKRMTQLAKETGITRDGLYKALAPIEKSFVWYDAKGD